MGIKTLPKELHNVVRLQGLSPNNKALCRYYRGQSLLIRSLIALVSAAQLDWKSVGINPELGAKVVALKIYNSKMNGNTPSLAVCQYNQTYMERSFDYSWWDELLKRPTPVIREIFSTVKPRTIHRWGNAVAMMDEWKERRK